MIIGERRSGRTTRLLEQMGDNGIFICDRGIGYIYDLCAKIGGTIIKTEGRWIREDGSVVRIFNRDDILKNGRVHRLKGWEIKQVIVDHAVRWDDEATRSFAVLKSWVR